MGLKEMLLGRLGKQAKVQEAPGIVSRPLSAEEKARFLLNLVDQTVLPRRIVLSGGTSVIEVLAGEKRLFGLVCKVSGEVIADHSVLNNPGHALDCSKILSDLLRIFSNSSSFSIAYSEAELPDDPERGLGLSDFETTLEKPPKPRLVLREPTTDMPEKAVENSTVPGRFLSAMAKDSRDTRQWQPDAKGGGFSGIDALYRKLSPDLGRELLFVVLAEGKTTDAFAFALNGAEGAALEMDRQKTGRCYLTWQKLTSETK